jgi:threonine synthase
MAHLGQDLGMTSLLLKDEGRNPTGTFKARGLSACVSRNHELGADRFAIPTAGNAGGALAAYATAAGCKAFIACPDDTPMAARIEVHVTGQTLRRVPGSIADAARLVGQQVAKEGWFDVSTLKEPYRLEGKKTMGLEIAEALNWTLPDVIVYPTGGGTGLIGMWKAFDELEELGLIASRRPRMVAVQAAGCQPIVRAFAGGHEEVSPWEAPATVASGLRVPKPFADREILEVLKRSGGTAVAVEDDEILAAAWDLAGAEGVFAAPEGAATVAALRFLRAEGWIEPKENVVLLNTGAGHKYLDLFKQEPKRHRHEPYDPTDH